MITLDLSRYRKYLNGYIFMYLNSKDGLGNIKNPEGGHMSHILKYGIIGHNNISLTYFECLEHYDNLGAFICLIMLTYPEKELKEQYLMDWDHLPYDKDTAEFIIITKDVS